MSAETKFANNVHDLSNSSQCRKETHGAKFCTECGHRQG